MELVVNPKLHKSQVLEFYRTFDQALTEEQAVKIAKSLRKSYVIGAYEEQKLVGLVSALSDYIAVVYIKTMLIRPDYQEKRIARTLMSHLMDYFAQVPQINVVLDDVKQIELYTSLGFKPLSENKQKLYSFERYQK